MSIADFFIARPVATTLLTLAALLTGVVAFTQLPVAPLPQVDFPTISVSATLPGASPETMAATVATPLERTLGRIAGVTEITSSSSLGSTRVTLQFDLSRNIDGAARDVQAALQAARTLLPTALPTPPTYRKFNPADIPIMILALTSDLLTQGQMYDAASTILAQRLAQIEGVGQVNVGGSALPAVRVELDPQALLDRELSVDDVRAAIVAANPYRPKGALEGGEQRWQIEANDRAHRAADYIPLIIRHRGGAAVRLGDLARVSDSVEDTRNAGVVGGVPAVTLVISRQPGANIIDTVDRIRAALPQLQAALPGSIHLEVAMDRTPTIRASLRDVERSLLISTLLVVLVAFVFLRSARAALIPCVAVPISLIGTFGVIWLLDYSLNNLSLMALTIATGFVVDDAVVVLENVTRYLEAGLSPREAARRGAREVVFTVLSMSVSLIAVFIPILWMGGIVGRLFREFAVTLSVAITISLVIALTTIPVLCSRWLRGREGRAASRPAQLAERGYARLLGRYQRSLQWALMHPKMMLLVFLATALLNVYLYTVVPKGFFPQQDTGRLIGSIQADESTSFAAMKAEMMQMAAIVERDPAVAKVVGTAGGGQSSSGQIFVALKPLRERGISADRVIARLRAQTAGIAGANLFLQAAQEMRIGGRFGGAQYQYTLRTDDIEELRRWEPRVRQAFAKLKTLADVNTDQRDRSPQTSLVVDRDAAARLGVDLRTIGSTLGSLFGQRPVSTIYEPLNQYRVILAADPAFASGPEALAKVYVRARGGAMVPLAAFSQVVPTLAPSSVNHQGLFAASTISFNLPVGVALSQAQTEIDRVMQELNVPSSIQRGFQGTASMYQSSLENQPILILAALLAVYIVLGILYESLIHPLTILSTLPSAGVGALLALLLSGTEFTVIAMIGVLLLIGIVKKNAIMMIDVAIESERVSGTDPRTAIFEACLLRFRPIMMTTFAALLGALPLALGAGDGAELRRPLGISIVGGLILSQLLTLYTTPVIYLYFDRLRHWARRQRRAIVPVQP